MKGSGNSRFTEETMKFETSIDEAVKEGYRVKLYYKEKYFQFDWRGKTKYFIYEVEIIEE